MRQILIIISLLLFTSPLFGDSHKGKILYGWETSSGVQLREFGTFFVKKIKEKYSARNPTTGELVYVPEKNKVRFKASKKLKKKINE